MRFMMRFHLSRDDRDAIVARVPAEQARVQELTTEGLVETLYLAADRSGGWIVMHGESEDAVRAAIATLPLAPYMQVELAALAS
jgi:muconolactone delta-isomerase